LKEREAAQKSCAKGLQTAPAERKKPAGQLLADGFVSE